MTAATKRKKPKVYDETFGPAHCGACQRRFMGEDCYEVTDLKTDVKIVIHQTCFDPERHGT